ncbi:MAG: glycine cleavage system protein GcvH [Clostridia bacterium]
MSIPTDLLYTSNHEWVKLNEDGTASIGLTDYAQHELGDLVFVNLPQEGDELVAGETFADVESVKAVSDVFSPVSGTVCQINEALLDTPQLINESAYEAWFCKVENVTKKGDLMNADAYQAFIQPQ